MRLKSIIDFFESTLASDDKSENLHARSSLSGGSAVRLVGATDSSFRFLAMKKIEAQRIALRAEQ